APLKIREVSQNIETYDPIGKRDAATLPVADAGDVIECILPNRMISVVEKVVSVFYSENKLVASLGGDHTVTLGVLKGLSERKTLVMFDAHLDYRNEYPVGERITHATVLRRACEWDLIEYALLIGVRGVSREEVETLEKEGRAKIMYAWATEEELKDAFSTLNRRIYISVDIDVLDPSIAPGVTCPEPGGLTYTQLCKALSALSSFKVLGLDIVEVNPLLDINDLTSYVTAKLLSKLLINLVS
ncbi:MAG: agmatinase, partial [Thermofilaceae archaeon]